MCFQAPSPPPMPEMPPYPEMPAAPPPAPTPVTGPMAGGSTAPTTIRPSKSQRASSQSAAARGPGQLRIPTASASTAGAAASSAPETSGGSINLNIGK
jgi:hypothetical protein